MEIPVIKVTSDIPEKVNLLRGRVYFIGEERTDLGMRVYLSLLYNRCDECPCSRPCETCESFGKECIVDGVPCDKTMTRGMMLTRTHPADIRRRFNIGEHPIYWLTTNITSKEMTLSPGAITKIHFVIEEFYRKTAPGVILIDCLEYLITQNSFDTILRLVQAWNDKIVDSKTRIIISVDPLTLSLQQLHLLKREMHEIHISEE